MKRKPTPLTENNTKRPKPPTSGQTSNATVPKQQRTIPSAEYANHVAVTLPRPEAPRPNQQTQLEQMAEQIRQLRQQLVEKDNELERTRLKYEKKLAENESQIKELQTTCNNANRELAETRDQMQLDSQKVQRFDEVMHETGTLMETMRERANEYKNRKMYAEALICFEDVIKLEKATQNRSFDLARFLVNKSFCHLQLKEYKKAVEVLDSVISNYDRNFTMAFYNRGLAYFHLGLPLNAKDDLDKVLKLDQTHEKAKQLLEIAEKSIMDKYDMDIMCTDVSD